MKRIGIALLFLLCLSSSAAAGIIQNMPQRDSNALFFALPRMERAWAEPLAPPASAESRWASLGSAKVLYYEDQPAHAGVFEAEVAPLIRAIADRGRPFYERANSAIAAWKSAAFRLVASAVVRPAEGIAVDANPSLELWDNIVHYRESMKNSGETVVAEGSNALATATLLACCPAEAAYVALAEQAKSSEIGYASADASAQYGDNFCGNDVTVWCCVSGDETCYWVAPAPKAACVLATLVEQRVSDSTAAIRHLLDQIGQATGIGL